MAGRRIEKPKRGRPSRNIPVHVAQVRMDKPMWEALEASARKQGTTASEVLRECAERYIKRHSEG